MIIVLILLVGIGIALYFARILFEEGVIYVFIGSIALVVCAILIASSLVQYENYTESYSLQQMSDGKYYSTTSNKVSVMILDGTIQKSKTFPSKVVSFVNGNTASIQVQGKRSSNDDLIKTLFFCDVKKKEIIDNVIISVPGNNSENPATEVVEKPLTENFCTSCGTAVKETDQFCSSCGQKLKSE